MCMMHISTKVKAVRLRVIDSHSRFMSSPFNPRRDPYIHVCTPRAEPSRSPKEKDPNGQQQQQHWVPESETMAPQRTPERTPGVYGRVASETGHIHIVQ